MSWKCLIFAYLIFLTTNRKCKMNNVKFVEGSYRKASVLTENNSETLYSYDTPIVRRDADGNLVRLWDGWSATTGRHIKGFCGLNKKEFLALELAK